ncbi:MAG: FprA family A-type flavoprotein [Muribaculaceae bacterium]|nr:FprA family A-type flavoprotein [Muribaculaceae bacterium]MDE6855303.1 FprA family A-type flavoprotein [Muribaculaceae bacterium]
MTGNIFEVAPGITYIGVDDHTIEMFENQYKVPLGVSYNSYLIKGEKTAVVDTTDDQTGTEWLANLQKALDGARPDYLIVEHLEPDHSSLISTFAEIYPEATLVMSATAARMLPQYMDPVPEGCKIMTVKEGDVLDLGGLSLQFILAPMVHWPEVMMAYCPERKLIFSADAFGTFGALDSVMEAWPDEAARYYFNIVGKYGQQVQNTLKKLSALDIKTICPLHGPVLTEDIPYYIGLYDTWSSYRPEKEGIFIACASIHGNTLEAAEFLAEELRHKGVKDVFVADLTRLDMSEAVAEAFRYPKAVFCASSYDAGLFTPMYMLLHSLAAKGYCNRKAALMENGSWAPSAGKTMRAMLSEMKGIDIMPETLTIRGAFKEADRAQIVDFASKIMDF